MEQFKNGPAVDLAKVSIVPKLSTSLMFAWECLISLELYPRKDVVSRSVLLTMVLPFSHAPGVVGGVQQFPSSFSTSPFASDCSLLTVLFILFINSSCVSPL